jgi:hypothetical protein
MGLVRYTVCALLPILVLVIDWHSQLEKNVFWTIDLATSQQITISTGDMLRVKSPSFAVVPANLGKNFQVSYDHSRLSLIAEKPPESEGRMGKQYFWLAIAPGASQITITVKDQEKTSTTVTLKVTCR